MSPELEAALARIRDYKMTPQERFEQRVSFIYGQQDYGSPNRLSKDEVRRAVMELIGSSL